MENTFSRPAKIQLFVAGQGSRSQVLEASIREILSQEQIDYVNLEVVDVLDSPELAETANVTLVPTLLFVDDTTPRRLIGAVDRREQLLWLMKGTRNVPKPSGATSVGLLADLSPDGIVLVDSYGLIVSSNRAARDMLGLSSGPSAREVFGLPLEQTRSVSLALASGVAVELNVVEANWSNQNGHLATLRLLPRDTQENKSITAQDYSNIKTENAALHSAVAQAKRAIDAMRINAEQLECSNDDLSKFAQRTAHDITSPATAIKHLLAALKEDEADVLSQDGQELLQLCQKSSDRLISLTDGLLDFSRAGLTKDNFKPVDLNTIVRWVSDDLKSELQATNAQLHATALPRVLGLPALMYQVMLNLIQNAIKYRKTDTPLVIKISHERMKDPGHAKISFIHIQDNGIGFDERYSERIFRPFERLHTSDSIPGSGIGLATVKRIVEQFGGQISATSETNNGARFTLRLNHL
jgi:signal transduction histidine kinase